jgi:hypothetical protein
MYQTITLHHGLIAVISYSDHKLVLEILSQPRHIRTDMDTKAVQERLGADP